MSIFHGRAVSAGAQVLDELQVRQALALLAAPEHCCELRGLPSGRNIILPGQDLDALYAAVKSLADSNGIYYTLNPVPLLTRPARASDVLCRRWILLDVDPIKPDAFKDASATDAEHLAAQHVAEDIVDTLAAWDWPAVVLVDSGNGYHVLVHVDLPNDDRSREMVKAFIKGLAAWHDSPAAALDLKVHNANRISKLPGTWSKKGANTADRPHRLCRILFSPPIMPAPVTGAMLEAALEKLGTTPTATPHLSVFTGHAPAAPSEAPGNSAYGRAALHREMGRVILAVPGGSGPDSGRNNALNRAAFSLGQLVAGGVLTESEVVEGLREAAVKAGLQEDPGCGPRGIESTIKSGIAAGREHPRGVPERQAHTANGAPGPPLPAAPRAPAVPQANGSTSARPTIYSLTELMDLELPPPNWAVPGLLSEGLSILAGKPKLGKSWMALNLGITIAAGGTALGLCRVPPGDVLYLSLEDRLRRVQGRVRKLMPGLDCGITGRLSISVEWPRQDKGGMDHLQEWMESAERPTLIIIDVWAKFRPAYTSGGSQYDQDYNHASAIKSLADRHCVSLLILHHCKKAAADDVVDEISGTLGLAGAADGLLILSRTRSETEGKLFCTGRDIDEKELAFQYDPQTFAWKAVGLADAHFSSKVRQAITEEYRRTSGLPLFPGEMAERIGMEAATVKKEMWRMEREGFLRRVGHKYAWPAEDPNAAPGGEAGGGFGGNSGGEDL